MLSLPHQFLLLSLDEQGHFRTHVFSFGLSAAMLAELVLQHKLELRNDSLQLLSNTDTSDPSLNEFLSYFANNSGARTCYEAIQFGAGRSNEWQKRYLQDLLAQGLVLDHVSKILGVFHRHSYPLTPSGETVQPEPLIYHSLIHNEEPSESVKCLARLAKWTLIDHSIFSRKERKLIADRWDSPWLLPSHPSLLPILDEVGRIIELENSAVVAAVVASVG